MCFFFQRGTISSVIKMALISYSEFVYTVNGGLINLVFQKADDWSASDLFDLPTDRLLQK